MHGRLGSLRFALLCTSILAVSVLAAACGGSGGSSSTQLLITKVAITPCTPAPLPPFGAMLISPAPNATGVSRTVGTVTFQIFTNQGSGAVAATVTTVSLIPTIGTVLGATSFTAEGTPSPQGETVFSAAFGTLSANTMYSVSIGGHDPSSCYTPYSTSAGSFTTGS